MEEYAYKSFLYEQLGGGEKCKNAENALHNFSTHTQARVYNIVCAYLVMFVCVCVYACAYVCACVREALEKVHFCIG